jgi:hypothetical protein
MIDIGGHGSRLALAVLAWPGRRARSDHRRSALPDDRRHEAIASDGLELLRRFRPRSLSYGGQVAPHNDDEQDTFLFDGISRTRVPSFVTSL